MDQGLYRDDCEPDIRFTTPSMGEMAEAVDAPEEVERLADAYQVLNGQLQVKVASACNLEEPAVIWDSADGSRWDRVPLTCAMEENELVCVGSVPYGVTFETCTVDWVFSNLYVVPAAALEALDALPSENPLDALQADVWDWLSVPLQLQRQDTAALGQTL